MLEIERGKEREREREGGREGEKERKKKRERDLLCLGKCGDDDEFECGSCIVWVWCWIGGGDGRRGVVGLGGCGGDDEFENGGSNSGGYVMLCEYFIMFDGWWNCTGLEGVTWVWWSMLRDWSFIVRGSGAKHGYSASLCIGLGLYPCHYLVK